VPHWSRCSARRFGLRSAGSQPPPEAGAPASIDGEVSSSPTPGQDASLEIAALAPASVFDDMIEGQGPTDFHVQSPGQNVRNGGDPGLPGHGTCAGGSNPENPPSH
jgi:hypothetical protein